MVGPGRAGLGVARAALAAGVDVVGLLGRRPLDAGPPFGPVWVDVAGDYPPALRRATVVLVAVQDRALDAALARVAESPLAPEAVVLQASGSAEPAAFALLRAAGRACGTFHPLVPLMSPERAPDRLRGAWVGLDGDPAAVRAAETLAARIGAHVLPIPPGERGRYHAAAVFASNFPVTLAAEAERLLAEAGVEPGVARSAVRHLLASAAGNLGDLGAGGDATLALTGPVARGDAATVGRHLTALTGDGDAAALYRALAAATVSMVRQAAAAGASGPDPDPDPDPDPAGLAAIETLLGARPHPVRGAA